MANVVRNYATLGPYAPVPVSVSTFITAARTESIEVGRLEVRERLFYAELDKILNPEVPAPKAEDEAVEGVEGIEGCVGGATSSTHNATGSGGKNADGSRNSEADLEQLLVSRLSGESVFRRRG